MPKLKIEAMTSQGAIFQGQNRPLLLYDCMESFWGGAGVGEWSDIFLMSSVSSKAGSPHAVIYALTMRSF